MRPNVPILLASATADGAALTASVTATSILHGSGKAGIQGGTFDVGTTIKALLRGRMSTVTTPGTLTFDCRLGPTANIVISALGALTLNATPTTNQSFELELEATIRALGIGTGANAIVTGRFCGRSLIGSAAVAAGGVGVITLPDTAPAVGTGFDSTVNNLFDVFATWGTNNANSIQVHQSWVWLLN
jgi:hypothetical protein